VTLSHLLAGYDHVLMDLDGCVYVGDHATPRAIEAIDALRAAGKGVGFVTNDGRYATEDPARLHEANLGFLSLWYTVGRDYGLHDGEWKMTGGAGKADSILIASEPLTRDVAAWVEVPEYSMLHAEVRDGRPSVTLHYLD